MVVTYAMIHMWCVGNWPLRGGGGGEGAADRKVEEIRCNAKDDVSTTWKCRRHLHRWIFKPFLPGH